MIRYATTLLLCASVRVPQLTAQDSGQAQVLATEDRRFAAMIRADTAALRSILAPDLAYTHTTGEKQDRTAFLHTLASGELRFKTIIPTERTVRLLGAEAATLCSLTRA